MNSPDFFAVVAALLALILLVDISVLWLTGRQVPELLGQLIFGVFGFYFGRAPGGGTRGRGDAETRDVEDAGGSVLVPARVPAAAEEKVT